MHSSHGPPPPVPGWVWFCSRGPRSLRQRLAQAARSCPMNEPGRKPASGCSAQVVLASGPALLSQPRHRCPEVAALFTEWAWVTLSLCGPGCPSDRGAVKHQDRWPRAARESRAPRLPPKPGGRAGSGLYPPQSAGWPGGCVGGHTVSTGKTVPISTW